MRLTGFWSGLDWDSWSYSLLKGIMSGGASGASAMLNAALIDSKDWALGSPNSFRMLWQSWLLGAAMFTFAFMSKSGLPDKKQREETREETKPLPKGGTVTTTVKDTSVVPINEPLPPKGDSK